MKPKRLTDRTSRMMARRERDEQWAFMERVAKEGVVWMCPWDKHRVHGRRCINKWCECRTFNTHADGWQCAHCKAVMEHVPDDAVYVTGVIGANEFFHWLKSHKDWWKRGRWSEKRCARPIRITEAGRIALRSRQLYDMEDNQRRHGRTRIHRQAMAAKESSMIQEPQYTPDELDRFADVCAWCANGVSAQKNTQGDYVHFPDGRQECLASRLRKQFEKPVMEQARDCFTAEKCPIEGHPKRARKDWFCVGCWRKLPADIQSKLRWLPKGWIVQWIQAMAMLKKAREKETNG